MMIVRVLQGSTLSVQQGSTLSLHQGRHVRSGEGAVPDPVQPQGQGRVQGRVEHVGRTGGRRRLRGRDCKVPSDGGRVVGLHVEQGRGDVGGVGETVTLGLQFL